MFDPHHSPAHIITNHLVITGIAVWHHEDFVLLMGFYGDPAGDCTYHYIEIECTFDALNSLLMELSGGSEPFRDQAERAERVIEELAEVLTHPGEEQDILDLNETDPLEFYEHVFSLALIHEEVDGQCVVPKNPSYLLRGYTRRATGWPVWADSFELDSKEDRVAYLARQLVLRYGLFLACNGKLRRAEALVVANLPDPQVFTLAQVQYELLEEAVRSRPGDYE